jgi:periplasmic protein TonB
MTNEGNRPNWLLQGFILISLGVHVIVFLHVAGIYESRAVSYIELSMQQIAKPNYRVIPKPRVRNKLPKIPDNKAVKMNVSQVKVDTLDNNNYEKIDLPDLPDGIDVSGYSLQGFNLQGPVVKYTNAKEYFEMLNLRVHSFKEYPEFAKSRHIEGRVKVEFVLASDGSVSNIAIVKRSRSEHLDKAALKAIQKASPFPAPPPFLFKTPAKLIISVTFEII